MAKIIKQAPAPVKNFTVGQTVNWTTSFHDGRSYETFQHSGKIVKVCRVNLHVEDNIGRIWEVSKEEANF